MRAAAVWRYAVDALEPQLLLALDAEAGHPPVGRIREVDRTVCLDNDIVGAVQLLALIVGRNHLTARACAVGFHPHDRARRVLADDEPSPRVIRHAVALVARPRHFTDAVVLVPAASDVARHVAEEEVPALLVPDRSLGEGEAA